jgi:pyrimidine operon attenuation protein/uracil phosphoribosyltransferase
MADDPSLVAKGTLLDRDQMGRVVRRMAGEVVERNKGAAGLMMVGIRTRGVPLAERLAAAIAAMEGSAPPIGVLDITLYRDDLSTVAPQPLVKSTHLPVAIDGWTIVLCDDVLYTGRTVRAALDHLVDYGRPKSVQLAVLIDRQGYREVPIQADVVGEAVATQADEIVEVQFQSTDGADLVRILERPRKPGAAPRLPRDPHAAEGEG